MTNRYSRNKLDNARRAGSIRHYGISVLALSVMRLIYRFVLIAEETAKYVGEEHDGDVLPETKAESA